MSKLKSFIFLSLLLGWISVYSEKPESKKFSLKEIVTQYQLKNFSVALKFSHQLTQLSKSEMLALNYMKAHSLFHLKDYSNALKLFLSLVNDVPYRYELYNNIGVCYFYLAGSDTKSYQMALKYFGLSISDNPNYKIARKNYTLLQNELSKGVIVKSDFPFEAGDFYLHSPASADINAGWVYYFLGNYVDAIYLFKNAIKSDPNYSLSYMSLGYVYDSSGNFESAIKYYEQALKLDPEYPDVWNNLGIAAYNLGQSDKALACFKKAIQLNPTFAYPENNLGFVYLQNGNFSEAKQHFQKSLDLKPLEPLLKGESYAGLAICNYHLSELENAQQNKKLALKLDADLADSNYLQKVLRWKDDIIEIFLIKIRID